MAVADVFVDRLCDALDKDIEDRSANTYGVVWSLCDHAIVLGVLCKGLAVKNLVDEGDKLQTRLRA
jgi:hypothetical protein